MGDVQQAETSATSEAPKWGELPDEGRQRALDGYLQAWDQLDADEQAKRLSDRKGPFAQVQLSGADVFYVAIGAAASVLSEQNGSAIDRVEAEQALRDPSLIMFLFGLHLEGADLTEARLDGAVLTAAHLEGASLIQAHLERAGLTEAHLQDANLRGARLEGADLSEARLVYEHTATGLQSMTARLSLAIEELKLKRPQIKAWIDTSDSHIKLGLASPIDKEIVHQAVIPASGQVVGLVQTGNHHIIAYVVTDKEYGQGQSDLDREGYWSIDQLHLAATQHSVLFRIFHESGILVAESQAITVIRRGT
jgi:pentapeptide repeat protein